MKIIDIIKGLNRTEKNTFEPNWENISKCSPFFLHLNLNLCSFTENNFILIIIKCKSKNN